MNDFQALMSLASAFLAFHLSRSLITSLHVFQGRLLAKLPPTSDFPHLLRDHSFSAYAKFSEKLKFLTP